MLTFLGELLEQSQRALKKNGEPQLSMLVDQPGEAREDYPDIDEFPENQLIAFEKTPTVSVVDFTAELERPATVEELNAAFRTAAAGPMQGILGVSDEPLVSSDFRGDPRSSIIDSASTMSLGGNFVKVIAWYDNEWGYSCRVADLVKFIGERL